MGNTLATMRGAEESTKRNRKRTLWERIKKDIKKAGITDEQAAALLKRMKSDLDELIEIASTEQYVCGHHDGMQKARAEGATHD